MHNTLYKLERGQKRVLLILGVLFLILSIVWWFFEFYNVTFPMEPIVVFFGGSATLLASYWPFKSTNKNRRLKGKNRFDYSTNGGYFSIGDSENSFILSFSERGTDSIYMMSSGRSRTNVGAIALAGDEANFKNIKDVTEFDYSSDCLTVEAGQIVALRSKETGRYALVKVLDVRCKGRNGVNSHEVLFAFEINETSSTSFA